MKDIQMHSKFILAISVAMLVGCGSGGSSSSDPNSTGAVPNESVDPTEPTEPNAGKTAQYWVPKRREMYNVDGSLSACARNSLDAEGYILSSAWSQANPTTGITIECADTDVNSTLTEYTYNSERSEFKTQSQSTYDSATSCQQTTLSSQNIPLQTVTYVSGSSNYSCSTQDGHTFMRQVSTLEEDLYDTLIVIYNGAGADGNWGTSDDSIQTRMVSTWSQDRLSKSTITYYGAGDDNQWGTEDDLATSILETTYKSKMVPDYSYTRYPGLDGKPNTDDDVVLGYANYNYENGNIKTHTAYSSAGMDNDWTTVEDNGKSYTLFY